MNFSDELAQQLKIGNVVLFVGAGLSIGAGFPDWVNLIHPLAQDIGARWPIEEIDLTPDYLLSIAQHYQNQCGRNALIRYLRETLDSGEKQPTAVHRLIGSFPISTIFTTNYDDLIERALVQIGRQSNIIVSDPEIAFWSSERIQIIKLCGDLQRPESIVITQRDFNTYFATHPRLVERLRTNLESMSPLFLGYSLQDPFFNQIWDRIGLDFGRLRRWGFSIHFEIDPLKGDDLRERGIHAIKIENIANDRTVSLLKFLQTLSVSSP
ncbi:MAG: hypothetical protein EXR62_04660 [Chloroflexi bacterium]|nr:hypothetical protein [Chloroflexota bacterium]